LIGLTDKEAAIFDAFEDDDYTKEIVQLEYEDKTMVQAFAYVWKEEEKEWLHGSWEFEHFLPHEDEYW